MIYNRYCTAFFLGLVIACSEIPYEGTCDVKSKIIQLNDDVVEIEITNNESYDWNHMDHITIDGKDLLYGLDMFRSEINIVDLENKSFVGVIELKDEGPDEVIDPLSIHVISRDSIFLMSISEWSTLYLVNSSGKKLNQWQINYPLPDEDQFKNVVSIVLWGAGQGDLPFFINNDKLVAICDYGSYEADVYAENYKRPLLTTVNLSARQIESLDHYRPETYRTASRIPHDDIANLARKGDDYLISFVTNAQVLNTKNGNYSCLSSMHSSGRITTFERGSKHEASELPKIFAMDDLYAGIHYDNVLEIGYRIFKKGYDQSTNNLQREECEWSIILFDKNLKTLGETTLFPGKKFNYTLVTVVEGKGLLISRENFLDEANKEEMLSFSLFRPTEFIEKK